MEWEYYLFVLNLEKDAESLGLDGTEYISIPIDEEIKPLQMIDVIVTKEDGNTINFQAQVRLDTPVEVEYYINGGILHTVLRNLNATISMLNINNGLKIRVYAARDIRTCKICISRD